MLKGKRHTYYYKLKMAIKELWNRRNLKIVVHNTEETLMKILEEHVSVCRYGDGEFSFIIKSEEVGHQKEDQNLRERLIDILSYKSDGKCIVCIPYSSYSLKPFKIQSKKFWFAFYALYRQEIERYLDTYNIYFDSQISRIYLNRKNKKRSVYYFDLWKKIWKEKRLLIVEGEKTRLGFANDLFSGAAGLKRILCPAINAYEKYYEILLTVKEAAGDFDMVLIALGITATVLAFDLSQAGIWAIDVGNIDNEYEWLHMGVNKPIATGYKYAYEAQGGRIVEDVVDKEYLSQIICKISI